MAVCPKCSFALVLLPKRLRYKCAKCGRLYMQRFIDDREFQRWNKKQREVTREELQREFEEIWNNYHASKKLTEKEKKHRLKKIPKKVLPEKQGKNN